MVLVSKRNTAAETYRSNMVQLMVETEPAIEGKNGSLSYGPVYRHPISKHGFPPLDDDMTTDWEIFSAAARKYPANKMLGWRKTVDGRFGPYTWKTYSEVYGEVLTVGSALRAAGAEPGCRVGIYGSNCPQWIMATEACNAHSLISVPLYDTLGPNAVDYIVNHAEIEILFVETKKIRNILNPDCESAKYLKTIISFTTVSEEDSYKADEIGLRCYTWENFKAIGAEKPSEKTPPKPSDTCMIMYTSGTSGNPKGVVIKHDNIASFVKGVDLHLDQFEDKMTEDDVFLSFLPLAHIFDNVIEKYFFRRGASVGYYHGDLNALRDDIAELKPTLIAGVPRVFEKIYDGIKAAVSERHPFIQWVFQTLYKRKLKWMNKGYKQKEASPLADLLAFRKVKARLGGRIRLLVSGGAPLAAEIEEFLRVTSGSFMLQGYGLTESCGPAIIGIPDDMRLMGSVGGVAVIYEMRLAEVPEMGYNPLDNPSRGEICLRGETFFSEYYKEPELTSEAIKDGWFYTGDIGEILPCGGVKIIDRKKNLVKLSQGEYVALEYLENVYCVSPIVEDIWVYGDSFKSKLVAVVVVNLEAVKNLGLNLVGSGEELCSLSQLRDHVLSELTSMAKRCKLKGFEYVKGVILEDKLFDVERDLVTPTMKKKRNKLLNYYQGKINDLYSRLM